MQKEFIGKEAIQRQMERGVNKRFVQLLVDRHDLDNDPWPQGEEPIYRNNKLIGWTTTAAYGFTLGCHVIKLKYYFFNIKILIFLYFILNRNF